MTLLRECEGYCGLSYPVDEFRRGGGDLGRWCAPCLSVKKAIARGGHPVGKHLGGICCVCRSEFAFRRGGGSLPDVCSKSCRWRRSNLLQKYGLLPAEYWLLYDRQGGLCAMPGCLSALPLDAAGHVDHCHDTGRVRGILCRRCNVAEGHWRKAESLGVREYLGLTA